MKFTKDEQENFDRYITYDVRCLAGMLIDVERAYEKESNEVSRLRAVIRKISEHATITSLVARAALKKKR